MAIEPSAVRLDDRVAVVTGAGSGIGRGIAAGLAAFGARVAIWEKDPDTCAEAAEEIDALGLPTDVRESAAVDEALGVGGPDPGLPYILKLKKGKPGQAPKN